MRGVNKEDEVERMAESVVGEEVKSVKESKAEENGKTDDYGSKGKKKG